MTFLIVFAHPEDRSFGGVMFRPAADAPAAAGHEVRHSDLHRMKFDPAA